jgi:membrane-associated phospholipid phosphatase
VTGAPLARARAHVHEWDSRLFDRLTRERSEARDAVLRRVTRLGDHSRVWIGCAGVVALIGGAKGRRVQREVLGALAIASLTANVTVKLTVGRGRPIARQPVAIRAPKSLSFPSGHAATSFAAATVLAGHYAWAAPAAYSLAGAIALSRVVLEVHYPLDVIAGAALGSVVGTLVLRIGRRARSE